MGKMELKSEHDESNVSQEDSTDGPQFKGSVISKLRDINGCYVSSRKDERDINENKDYVVELGQKAEMIYEKLESAREKYSKSLKEYRSIKSQIELKAQKRFESDSDATARLKVATIAMRNCVVALSVEKICKCG